MSLALLTVKVLRRLPITARFDRHLTDCAALEVFYGPSNPRLPSLTLGHVLRFVPLPRFFWAMTGSGFLFFGVGAVGLLAVAFAALLILLTISHGD